MTATLPTLTYKADGLAHQAAVRVDLDRLIASRMLVQANSGGGKSRAIRQLLEETHGRVQHLVIDPEGEFSTLREKFDYVHAAKSGGDVLASPKTAKLLCRRLVELGASAVLDLYELPIYERREFVRLFLFELVNLPRSLWRPILVVIDEAHAFAPQAGESQALDAVIALCTLGRKRGFCAVLATQRISKLHKDAAAELNNKLIGRTGLDVDVKRAGDELGFDKEGRAELARLAPGEFFAYGPAIASTVTRVRTGAVKTTHPEAGQISAAITAAPAKVRAMLAQLADLPQEAEAEARTVEDLKRDNAALRAKLTRVEKDKTTKVVDRPVIDQVAVDRAVAAALVPIRARFQTARRAVENVNVAAGRFVESIGILAMMNFDVDVPKANGNGHPPRETFQPITVGEARRRLAKADAAPNGSTLGKGERRVLAAIAGYPDGVERNELTVLAGYKKTSRDQYISRLVRAGCVDIQGSKVVATPEGIAELGDDFERLPTGQALQRYWLDRLTGGEREILEVLIDADGGEMLRDQISTASDYKKTSRDQYLGRLIARRLVETVGRGTVRASATLFDER